MTTTLTHSFIPTRSARPALALLVAAVAVLAGCASNVPLDNKGGAAVENRDPNANRGSSSDANTGKVPDSNVASVDLSKGAGANDSGLPNIVYFDFDSFVVKDEFRPTVEGYSKLLNTNKQKHVQVEGHTDERGGREYNLALGQKRAEAVAKAMTLMGASQNQVEAVSFGKERPAVQGSDEAAWAKNRRAEINGR